MMEKHTISVLVENEFGVLARVSGMFAARGYNIDSLSVAPTLDPKISVMTIVTSGSPEIIEQIIKQLNRLIDVIQVRDLTGENFVSRETILVKVKISDKTRPDLLQLAELFRSEVADANKNCMALQFTGEKEKVESFLKLLEPFGVLELIRTGTIAIQRGTD
jgi:acetolactate synthase I/III small subunit